MHSAGGKDCLVAAKRISPGGECGNAAALGLSVCVYTVHVFTVPVYVGQLQVQQAVPGYGKRCVQGQRLWLSDVYHGNFPHAQQHAGVEILCILLFAIFPAVYFSEQGVYQQAFEAGACIQGADIADW